MLQFMLHQVVKPQRLLFFIFVLALGLRTIEIGSTHFQNGDDASVAWATTWYYPRGLESFRTGDNLREPNPAGIITLSHGPLQPAISYLGLLLTGISGENVRINERSWHLPFALVASLTPVASYLLVSALHTKRAGLLATLFTAVVPLHVAFSRTSGESHFILSALLQLMSIYLWWKYLQSGRKLLVLLTGVVVALDMLTDFMFPGLLLTLFLATYYYYNHKMQPSAALKRTFGELLQWSFVILLAVPTAIHLYTIMRSVNQNDPIGMFGRLFSEGGAEYTYLGGFFLAEALWNLNYATNWLVVGSGILLLIVYLTNIHARVRDRSGSTVLLIWTIVLLMPFVFLLSRERLVGHFITSAIAMCAFIAVELENLRARPSFGIPTIMIAGIVCISMSLTTLSMVFRIQMPEPFLRPAEHGSIGVERGTKTAALSVRNSPVDTVIFTDPYSMQSLSLSMYYYHRPVVSEELGPTSTLASAFNLLSANLHQIGVIIVGIDHLEHLPTEALAQFTQRATVQVHGVPSLVIFSNLGHSDTPPELLEAEIYNAEFDQKYSSLDQIISLPFKELQEIQLVESR